MGDFAAEWERPDFESVPTLAENAEWRLPGNVTVPLRKSLQEAYRDFCRRSAALRTWRKVDLIDGVTRYAVAPILSGEIDCIAQVVWSHSRAEVRGWRAFGDAPPQIEIPRWVSGRHLIECEFAPRVEYVQAHENTGVTPVEIAVEEDEPPRPRLWSVLVEVVEVPYVNEERAPKAFLARYGEAILSGALVRLFSMQGKAWTDAEQARQHGIHYENAIAEARLRGMRGGPAANAGKTNAIDMSGMV